MADNSLARVAENNIKLLAERIDKISNRITPIISDINSANTPIRNYEEMYDAIDVIGNEIRMLDERIELITSALENYKRKTQMLHDLKEQIALALNNNKFKYGLKGQLKGEIKKSIEEGKIRMQDMSEEEIHAYKRPYRETPYEPKRGGKGSRKRRRLHRVRVRKSRRS